MTLHQEAADDADRYLKSLSYQSTGGSSGGSLCEALSKLREKTVARQEEFFPQTPAPPRHSSDFLNVVLSDRSHSAGAAKDGGRPNTASSSTSSEERRLNGNGSDGPMVNGNGSSSGGSNVGLGFGSSSASHSTPSTFRPNPSPLVGISQQPYPIWPENSNQNGKNKAAGSNSNHTSGSHFNGSKDISQTENPNGINGKEPSVPNDLPPADVSILSNRNIFAVDPLKGRASVVVDVC